MFLPVLLYAVRPQHHIYQFTYVPQRPLEFFLRRKSEDRYAHRAVIGVDIFDICSRLSSREGPEYEERIFDGRIDADLIFRCIECILRYIQSLFCAWSSTPGRKLNMGYMMILRLSL